MKHISSRGPYLSSRKAANSASLSSPYKSRSSLHLRHDALTFIQFSFWLCPLLSFNTAFLLQSSYFFSLTWALVGHYAAVASPPLLTVWAWTWMYQIRWEQALHLCEGGAPHRGQGGAAMIDTSQTLPLALIGCVDLGAVDSCKSNYSHWVEPQKVDFFYTANLYLILLSDHNDSFSKYNKKNSYRLQH